MDELGSRAHPATGNHVQLSVHSIRFRETILGKGELRRLNTDNPHAEFKLVSTLSGLQTPVQTDVIAAACRIAVGQPCRHLNTFAISYWEMGFQG